MKQMSASVRATLVTVMVCVTGFVLLVSILCFSITSLGWFSFNEDSHSSGMTVTSAPGMLSMVGLESYPVMQIEDVSGATRYTFDSTSSLLELPVYDQAAIIDGVHKKALVIRIECQLSADDLIVMEAQYSEPWRNNAPAAMYIDSDMVYQNALSNCVQIRPVTLMNLVEGGNGVVTTQGNIAPQTFVNPSTYAKSNINLGTFAGSHDMHTFYYFVIEYNESLVNHFCLGTTYSKVEYSGDITFHIRGAD